VARARVAAGKRPGSGRNPSASRAQDGVRTCRRGSRSHLAGSASRQHPTAVRPALSTRLVAGAPGRRGRSSTPPPASSLCCCAVREGRLA
jgi:hypothetical protein